MTSVERVNNALNFEKTDRVPVIPEIIQHALEVSGAVHRQYSKNGKVMADTIIKAQEKYMYDAVYVSSDNYVLVEAFGGKVLFPYDDAPQLAVVPLAGGYSAGLPDFDLKNGRLHVILEATKIAREHYKDTIFVKTNIDSAPFSAAACIRGTQNFLMDLYDEDSENDVLNLLDVCTDAIVRYGIAASEAGAHGIAFGDSVAGLINREMYMKFALPYAQKVISEIRKKTGLPVFYHVCGNANHILDLLVETGADCIEVDSMVDMKKFKDIAWKKCCVEGNISTIDSLYEGTVDDVRREAFVLLDLWGNNGGFILSSACEIPRNSPSENVMEITRSAMEYDYGR